MTNPRGLCLFGLLLAGCGGAVDFAGSYSGILAAAGTCSDGSSTNTSDSFTWTLTDSGGAIQATFSGACSGLSATASGNVANVAAKQCVPVTINGATETNSITDGTLTLNAGTLAVLTHNVVTFSGAASGTCNETLSGNLTKQ